MLNFESAAGNAKGGFAQGVKDAHSFLAVAKGLGLNTAGITGYFSVDYDVSPAGMPVVLNYLRGVASILGHDHTGVYGSYYVVKAASAAKVCKYLWQTYAWSGGRWYAHNHIEQYKNEIRFDGQDCDMNRGKQDSIGVY